MGRVDPISAAIPPAQIREFVLGTNVFTDPVGPRTGSMVPSKDMVKIGGGFGV
jgi:hypothetical protein